MIYVIEFRGRALIEAKDNDEALERFAKMKKTELVKTIKIRHCEETGDKNCE